MERPAFQLPGSFILYLPFLSPFVNPPTTPAVNLKRSPSLSSFVWHDLPSLQSTSLTPRSPPSETAIKDKNKEQPLKQKMRERVQPKMGKMDIDYQMLHDAFFRFQRAGAGAVRHSTTRHDVSLVHPLAITSRRRPRRSPRSRGTSSRFLLQLVSTGRAISLAPCCPVD
jgi:hypothetical protein